jgi:hypothetical protein
VNSTSVTVLCVPHQAIYRPIELEKFGVITGDKRRSLVIVEDVEEYEARLMYEFVPRITN